MVIQRKLCRDSGEIYDCIEQYSNKSLKSGRNFGRFTEYLPELSFFFLFKEMYIRIQVPNILFMNYKRSAQKALQVRQKIKAADEFFLNECLSDVNGYSSGLMDSRAKKERNIPKYLKGS